MTGTDLPLQPAAAVPSDHSTVLVALELSRASWLAVVSALGTTKVARHGFANGDGPALLELLGRLTRRAEYATGGPVRVVTIQEAGIDAFWMHRLLEADGLESHVVDPASIAVNRRRRAKTDGIDADALLRTLAAWWRGERRVCSMVRPPSPEDEDLGRAGRERRRLIREKIQHTNRIKGLLATQGITG